MSCLLIIVNQVGGIHSHHEELRTAGKNAERKGWDIAYTLLKSHMRERSGVLSWTP
jgi:hypothetical protein